MRISQSMQLRLQVGRAVAFLAAARFLVRAVPLRLWRGSLGDIVTQPQHQSADSPSAEYDFDDAALMVLRQALMFGRCVDRASEILPGHSRCLPQAVALQWIMRAEGILSQIIIAFNIHDRSSEHAYHAWVEHRGEMLIGHCDRSSYRAILTMSVGKDTPFPDAFVDRA